MSTQVATAPAAQYKLSSRKAELQLKAGQAHVVKATAGESYRVLKRGEAVPKNNWPATCWPSAAGPICSWTMRTARASRCRTTSANANRARAAR